MEYQFQIGDKTYKLAVRQAEGDRFLAEMENEKVEFAFTPLSDNCFSIFVGEKSYTAYFASENHKKYIFVEGEQYEIGEISGKSRVSRGPGSHDKGGAEGDVFAPMPGKLLKIFVSQDEVVEAGQPLFIVESMKMENEVRSPIAGKVKKINYEVNALVSIGDPIIELEKNTEEGETSE